MIVVLEEYNLTMENNMESDSNRIEDILLGNDEDYYIN
jgi:hypothetical protein